MAKIEFTAIVSEITGRLSGTVFQKSVGGNQIRSIGWGVNRRVRMQQANRDTLATLAQQWRLLTNAQRNSWAGGTNHEKFISFMETNFLYNWTTALRFNTPPIRTALDLSGYTHAEAQSTGGTPPGIFLRIFGTKPSIISADARKNWVRLGEWTPVSQPLSNRFFTAPNYNGADVTLSWYQTNPAAMPLGKPRTEFIYPGAGYHALVQCGIQKASQWGTTNMVIATTV